MKTLLLTTVFTLFPAVALAQSIETGQLGAAQAFDAGVIDARNGREHQRKQRCAS